MSIMLVACSDNQFDRINCSAFTQHRLPSIAEVIPYASSYELVPYSLNECYSTRHVLNYKLARDLAYIEFMSNIDLYYPQGVVRDLHLQDVFLDLGGVSLSDKPVVVYDYTDEPYYYEFTVLYNETVKIGTITVNAKPRSYELIAYVFPSSMQYDTYDCSHRRYVGEYPVVYYRDSMGYVKKVWSDFDEVGFQKIYHTPTLDYSEMMQLTLDSLTSEEMDNIDRDLQNPEYHVPAEFNVQHLETYLELFMDNDTIRRYWDSVSTYTEEPDSSFCFTAKMDSIIQHNVGDVEATEVGFLTEYMDHRLRFTQWRDYCGPAALSWIYRGKYNSFKDTYIKIYGDGEDIENYQHYWEQDSVACYYLGPPSGGSWPNNYETRETRSKRTDGGLYYTFFQYCRNFFGTFPLFDKGIRNGVEDATNGEYKIKFITAPISWIREQQQPVLVEGIGGHAHYWAAIGYGYQVASSGVHYNLRIFVTDNGAYNSAHGYYPYWSCLGGLNYAWERTLVNEIHGN